MINISEYNLPDIHLFENESNSFLLWIPDKSYIVLGASNHWEDALITDNVKRDNIAVLKRPSGGQTVMLTPDNLIISAIFFDKESLQPKEIFQNLNRLIVSAIEAAGVKDLSLNGISDIEISGQKIMGSSIYRNKKALLYHAVLNLGEPAATFEKYLKHPVKEPDYRNGRKHSEFVTSLREKGYTSDYTLLKDILNEKLKAYFS